jgi:ABC-2 type transport system permease protein
MTVITESASEAAPGYSSTATLPLRVEAVRQIRRRRTAVALALMAALPVIVWAALTIGDTSSSNSNTPDLIDVATSSGINFAFAVVFLASGFLLSVPVALYFGDTVASEANWSSLRYLLVAPVSRTRLLYSKFTVALGLSAVSVLLLPATALAIGMAAYGSGGLHLPLSGSLSFGTAVSRFAIIAVYLLVCQLSVASFALWLSTRTDAPLGAVGGAVGLVIVSSILDNISALGSLRTFLPTHGMYAWADILQPSPEWTGMIEGVSLSLSFAVLFYALALRHFRNQDIVS